MYYSRLLNLVLRVGFKLFQPSSLFVSFGSFLSIGLERANPSFTISFLPSLTIFSLLPLPFPLSIMVIIIRENLYKWIDSIKQIRILISILPFMWEWFKWILLLQFSWLEKLCFWFLWRWSWIFKELKTIRDDQL